MARDFPFIASATGMKGRWNDDIAAIGFDVDARAKHVGATAKCSARTLIGEMTTTATSETFDRCRKFPVLGFKIVDG